MSTPLARALQAPMDRLGYSPVGVQEGDLRFVSQHLPGPPVEITVATLHDDPIVLQGSVTLPLLAELRSLADAAKLANRIHQKAWAGRLVVDFEHLTVRYDLAAAVPTLDALGSTDEPTSVLPKLLMHLEAADRVLRLRLRGEAAPILPRRVQQPFDLAKAYERYGAVGKYAGTDAMPAPSLKTFLILGPIQGIRYAGAAVLVDSPLGLQKQHWDESEDSPPPVVPELFGTIIALNASCPVASLYMRRQLDELEVVQAQACVIVTSPELLPKLTYWLSGEVEAALKLVRETLTARNLMPVAENESESDDSADDDVDDDSEDDDSEDISAEWEKDRELAALFGEVEWRSFAHKVGKTGQAAVTPRKLLSWFGAKKPDRTVMKKIRAAVGALEDDECKPILYALLDILERTSNMDETVRA